MARKNVAKGAHAVHVCVYHLVFATKYRRPVLDLTNPGGDVTVSERLKELVHERCSERGWTVRAIETMPDHVHVILQADNVASPHYIAAQIKGYTSKVLRSEFPVLRSRIPSLWTRSYFIATAGEVSAATIEQYVQAQRSTQPPSPRRGGIP